MARTPSSQAFTDLVLEVFRLNGRLLSAGDSLTRPLRQTSSRWQVLGALDDRPQTVAEIGRQMGLTRQSVQRTADLLEADGLLAFADNPAHRRAKLAALTPRGRAALEAITNRQISWANRIATRLVEADVRTAIRTLEHVRAAVVASAVVEPHRTPTRSRNAPRRPAIGMKRRKRT